MTHFYDDFFNWIKKGNVWTSQYINISQDAYQEFVPGNGLVNIIQLRIPTHISNLEFKGLEKLVGHNLIISHHLDRDNNNEEGLYEGEIDLSSEKDRLFYAVFEGTNNPIGGEKLPLVARITSPLYCQGSRQINIEYCDNSPKYLGFEKDPKSYWIVPDIFLNAGDVVVRDKNLL